ncbi:MAG: isochorismatase family protein [Dechloromonas sp.]|nr:isochorismatase family protein [Dechloromonas sp.]
MDDPSSIQPEALTVKITPSRSVLLVVDIQGALLPAIDGGDDVLANTLWLMDIAALLGVPALATEHCPQRIGLSEPRLRSRLAEDRIVEKTWFSAVAEGNLLQAPSAERQQWIVTGMESHVCVQQTVLDLLAAKREVFVVDEAVGSRRPRDKELALLRMRQNGAEIVSREMVAFEWLENADSPAFREILKGFIR